ncbi:glycosyltransferase family 2 protein [Paenibacillus sp. LPE1-1-1.1]|uniref:glycosyltransferase family 2 protein n=1 Tax=Paenibacillus sp. LPE1-1-1.1 TaxID=3135230 RepID=UPI0034460968
MKHVDAAVSVVVPIYNAEKWLYRGLDRILRQPFRSIELLLVNDGSTDHSGAICEEYAAKDARIKVLHKANGGTSSAKNAGFKAATGKYIAFLDADDEIDELFFAKLYAAAEEHACDIVVSGFETIPSQLARAPRFTLHTVMNGKDFVLSAASVHSDNELCFVWRCLFLHSWLANSSIRFQEELTIGEDTIFLLESMLSADRVYAIPDCLYFYNTVNNLDSLMRAPYKPYLERSLVLQYRYRKQHSEKSRLIAHDHYRKDMAVYYIQTILGMLIKNMKNSPTAAKKEDLAKLVSLEMFTDSTKALGFRYKCASPKEYIYYLAFKFKLSAVLFYWEFGKPAARSFFPFNLFGKSKRLTDQSLRINKR